VVIDRDGSRVKVRYDFCLDGSEKAASSCQVVGDSTDEWFEVEDSNRILLEAGVVWARLPLKDTEAKEVA